MPSRIPSKAPDKSAAYEVQTHSLYAKLGPAKARAHLNRFELRYYEAKHQYFALGGRWESWTWVPSCTAIAKLTDPPGDRLVNWAIRTTADAIRERLEKGPLSRERVLGAIEDARKAPDRKKDSAGDYGTAAHALFERAMATKVWRGRVAADLRQALEAMRRFRDEWAVEVLDSEFLVLHPVLGYAGTGDLRFKAMYVPQRMLPEGYTGPFPMNVYADLKTGKGTYLSNFAQVSGYELADRAVGGKGWDLALLLHLPQQASAIDVIPQRSPRDDARAFEYARFLHWWAKERTEDTEDEGRRR